MATNTGARWQPIGDQFPYACRVCCHGIDTALTVRCRYCKMEERPGFEFDPDRYISFVRSIEDKYRALEYRKLPGDDALKTVGEDRDFWKSLAKAAIQRLY